ncbi:unnamed protein product [Allacma fusca]|uniref:ZP domain-containing protein n=1 Tax=Allacma fusca TaxID=39272 RepID=A0A8J2LYE5_9HEXA|nr:unnamed protein product [Allacma fusca]
MATILNLFLTLSVLMIRLGLTISQDYEVADIDCAVGTGGKELLTARLRKPDGFRGSPIFADDRGTAVRDVAQDIAKDLPCQIQHDPTDASGRVYVLRVTDFTECGVLKRNGFIHVRVWFPQLPGVVMLSDQEVIIMCKPPQPTVTQSKAAGFAGSIPSGARVSGIVEESPGRLEYEVALYRESGSTAQARSSSPGAGAYITGADSQELPVDQAVPIGTRLQLRAKINPDSSWKHAKLMEVSVSPDPKDGSAEGSVALIKEGCRNPDLVSIIPKQPYRFKDRNNEVVLDFEAFLLSNMGERNTLWLHTQIKACMESQDCHPEFCMDVYQPSGFGRKKRDVGATMVSSLTQNENGTAFEYATPLAQHWRAIEGPISKNMTSDEEITSTSPPPFQNNLNVAKSPFKKHNLLDEKKDSHSTKFGNNIGFSVIMPAEYYRNAQMINPPFECRGWAAATLFSLLGALIAGTMTCFLSYKLRQSSTEREKTFSYIPSQTPVTMRTTKDGSLALEHSGNKTRGIHDGVGHHLPTKYARDSSIYRS